MRTGSKDPYKDGLSKACFSEKYVKIQPHIMGVQAENKTKIMKKNYYQGSNNNDLGI